MSDTQEWLRRWNFLRLTLLFIAFMVTAIFVRISVGNGLCLVVLAVGAVTLGIMRWRGTA
jgi:hypothetical protein